MAKQVPLRNSWTGKWKDVVGLVIVFLFLFFVRKEEHLLHLFFFFGSWLPLFQDFGELKIVL